MKDRTKKGLLDLLLLLAGTLLLAFAVKCIYEPLDMVTGGFSGLAILIKAVTWEAIMLITVKMHLIPMQLHGIRQVYSTL